VYYVTVASAPSMLPGTLAKRLLTADSHAHIITKHALESSGGKTYADLDQDDPTRDVVMNGSFLRASLFTSVIAFGIAAFVIGLGVLFILVGWGLRALAGRPVTEAPGAAAAADHAAAS